MIDLCHEKLYSVDSNNEIKETKNNKSIYYIYIYYNFLYIYHSNKILKSSGCPRKTPFKDF